LPSFVCVSSTVVIVPSSRRGRRTWRHRLQRRRGEILRVVLGEQLSLALHLREAEVDEDPSDQDGDDSGQVRPTVAVEEGRFRGGLYLSGVARVLLRDRLGAGE